MSTDIIRTTLLHNRKRPGDLNTGKFLIWNHMLNSGMRPLEWKISTFGTKIMYRHIRDQEDYEDAIRELEQFRESIRGTVDVNLKVVRENDFNNIDDISPIVMSLLSPRLSDTIATMFIR